MTETFIHPDAVVESNVKLGVGVRVWGQAQIRSGCIIGDHVVIGRNVYVGPGVEIGSNSKIQNSANLYEPVKIASGVFVGPGVIFSNDRFPRAINVDNSQKVGEDWEMTGVMVNYGASIGAGAICVAPLQIGSWAMVGAGSVVTSDVPDFALVIGTPARRVKWVGKLGFPLKEIRPMHFECPKDGSAYQQVGENELIALS